MPKVSVIIPVCNVEKYLCGCLDSVLGQTLKDIEVIAVDDGSTDGSVGILDGYAARDPRVRVIRQTNAGAGAARNTALEVATGEYLSFVDGDDWMDSRMLSAMFVAAVKGNADVAACGFFYYDESTGRDYRRVELCPGVCRAPFAPTDIRGNVFTALRIQTWNKLFLRSFVKRQELRFQDQPRVNDLAFVAECVALAERIVVIPDAYYHYRKNQGENLSSKIDLYPDMSVRAWLHVKDVLLAKGVFPAFKCAFDRASAGSVFDVITRISDLRVLQRYYERLQVEFLPLLGLAPENVFEAHRTIFNADGPLSTLMTALACERASHLRDRERLFCHQQLFEDLKAGRFLSVLRKLFRRKVCV